MVQLIRLPSALRQSIKSWLQRASSWSDRAQREDREGLLEQEKSDAETSNAGRWQSIKNIRIRRYIVLVCIATILSLLLTWAFRIRSHSHTGVVGSGQRNAQTLHLLIPTPDLNAVLCKTVLSAEILHYSTPTLVRWDAAAKDPRKNAQNRTTAVRDYLGKLREHHENDIVILLDSVSTWFQLRPEVLLKRYYEIILQEDHRVATSMGTDMMDKEAVKHSIVFAASSKCRAASDGDAECTHIPGSPLTELSLETSTPRYLHQALVIGPVKGLHEIYRRAVAITERADEYVSEQAVFADIIHSQERHRQSLQPKSYSWTQRFRGWFSGKDAHAPLANRNSTSLPKKHANEFGIGLDYTGALGLTTSNSLESFTWTQHRHLPEDILASMPPFWTTSGQGLPSDKAWSNLNLLTSASNLAIPVLIHHNITANSHARAKQWESVWLRTHSRKLFDAYMTVPAMPLTSVVDNEGVEQVFWSTTIGEKAGVKVSDGSWIGWKDLCKEDKLANEIFGDGLGEWRSSKP